MDIRINDDEKLDDLEYKNLKILQKKDGFCFGMDSVILSNFVKISGKNAIVADLGTGTRNY
jgi:tRNA1(Val) A37 N6-methylase TrmN6